jgi:hypothetical protein
MLPQAMKVILTRLVIYGWLPDAAHCHATLQRNM